MSACVQSELYLAGTNSFGRVKRILGQDIYRQNCGSRVVVVVIAAAIAKT